MKVTVSGLHEQLSEREVDECRGDVLVVPLGVARGDVYCRFDCQG